MAIQLSHKKNRHGDYCQHYVFFKNINSHNLGELTDAISEFIFEHKISLIEVTICGAIDLYKTHKKAEKKTFGEPNWPIRWLNNSKADTTISGYYSGVSETTVKTLLGSNFTNKVFETTAARYCYTGEVHTNNIKDESSVQLSNIFDTYQGALLLAGIETKHNLRSWFNLNNISEWNTNFRNPLQSFIAKNNITTNLTNIESKNQHKSEIAASFFAIKPLTNNIKVTPVYSEFFHALSQEGKDIIPAIKIQTQENETLFFSGSGNFINTDDLQNSNCEKQIKNTLDSFEKVLIENDFSWKDLIRAIAYFKDVKDFKFFKQLCKEKRIPAAPMLTTQAKLNNTDLLFELEADFSKQTKLD